MGKNKTKVIPPSLYIHIPFCLKKCAYCDFHSIPFDGPLASRYVCALSVEAQRRAGEMGVLGTAGTAAMETAYIGGGTPNSLGIKELETLMGAVHRNFSLRPGGEFTVEVNPVFGNPDKLKLLFDAGVNRLSIGAQSFSERELEFMGRPHGEAEIERTFFDARQAGFQNISLDLIYAIPGQGMESWQHNVEKALSLQPEHLSLYELTPEEGTPLYSLLERGHAVMPGEEDALAMQQRAEEMLLKAGYARYEVSSYSLPAMEAAHNLNYWARGEYLGLGAAAHSFKNSIRWSNVTDPQAYVQALDEGRLPVERSEPVSPDEAAREFVLLGLRTTRGLDMEDAEGYKLDLGKHAQPFVGGGLLEISGGRLRPTGKGFALLNRVTAELIEAIGL